MRRRARGFTLLEVLVSIGVTAMIAALIYSAFYGMNRTRTNMTLVADRYGQGRNALSRMARELSSAFVSAHRNFNQQNNVRETGFIGHNGRPDRVDFTAFAHQRLARDAHESDQAEISYFLARSPEGGLDLVRRLSRYIDDDPSRGGLVQVLCENVEDLDFRYLDPATGEWTDTWDSTQPAAQLGRLPAQVSILLVVAGGPRGESIRFETKVPLAMQLPINFATN